MKPTVLIVDDEKHTREGLQRALDAEFDVYLAEDGQTALNLLETEHFDLLLADLRMPSMDGLKLIKRALSLQRPPICILMTAYGTYETGVEAMKLGAYDCISKPVNLDELEVKIKKAVRSRNLERENVELRQRLDTKFGMENIIGESAPMKAVFEMIQQVAPSRATAMITGASGTGKELVAHAIHQLSPRKNGPFVAVHCAALPPTLLESELFGHERGAFTGATERRIGRFEAADAGTLFLDEIGEISLATQVKLLRFLETKSIERIGSMKPIQLDVRLVAATNKNLEQMVKDGTFREDLFFRLNVVRMVMPPLRERPEDVPLLLDHYFKILSAENAVAPPVVEPGALRALQAYAWPGNVRELRNFVENAVVLRRGGRLTEYDLDPKFRGGSASPVAAPAGAASGAAMANPLSVEENEKRLLREALIKARGNRTKAAELMGISRRTLHRKLALWPEVDVVDR